MNFASLCHQYAFHETLNYVLPFCHPTMEIIANLSLIRFYFFSRQILEYWDDLKKYWQDGYGFQINYEQSCVLVKELVDQLM